MGGIVLVTLDDVKSNSVLDSFIRKGNEFLGAMGYTEHSYRHINLVSSISKNILDKLEFSKREAELAAIAGYLHDLGNVVSRNGHGIAGATMCSPILLQMGMDPDEVATVISAIANHEEQYGQPVSPVAAALIIADKSDVHRSRVRNMEFATFDIHDRVNYAVENSLVWVDEKKRTITMELTINIKITPVMEYFEIFLSRMLLCRRAAVSLECVFELVVNGAKLL